jgi:hypothetical protein
MAMTPEEAQERFKVLVDLAELAEEMTRARLRREDPQASPEVIEARVEAWLADRPGAEHGDAEGRVIDWPHRR